MEIPAALKLKELRHNKVLKLVNNLYGKNQAGCVWNLNLTAGQIKPV
jgi:hypothetical protein